MPHASSHIAATWSDTGRVNIWDLTSHVQALDHPGTIIEEHTKKPISTVQEHRGTEGYAMDWSSTQEGRLLTGDMRSNIYLTQATSSSTFVTSNDAFQGHTGSVEDIQWSPNEPQVFSSCSCDGTIKVWDCRKKKHVLSINASNVDVNVISWNKRVTNLLASGSDDGVVKVWDFRKVATQGGACDPFAEFKWHSMAITSIEWCPQDDSALVVSGADNQVTLWDFSVEEDHEEQKRVVDNVQVPSQLLFIHQGQTDVKEVHWHPQIPGAVVSTAASGFNIFKTISF
jgi:ribosome assembly protein RRB1